VLHLVLMSHGSCAENCTYTANNSRCVSLSVAVCRASKRTSHLSYCMRFGNVFICRGKQGLKIFREHKLKIIFDPEKETDNCMGKYLYIVQ
jgi:hypothetical protein